MNGPRPTPENPWLFFIGLRGTGKSSVARLVADRLGRSWWDSDLDLERRANRTIADILERDGEPAFRTAEAASIAAIVEHLPGVLSLGGGAVIRPETRELLAARGRVVWLTASPAVALARIEADPQSALRRPPLTHLTPLEEITELFQRRRELYQGMADFTVDTDRRTVAETVDSVLAWWNEC